MTAGQDFFDVVVLGGGTAGCVLASRLSEDADRSVALVEAGPDYGSFTDGNWPAEMLDPRTPPDTHDWEPGAELSLSRAKVIGGCSSHNACFVAQGHPDDYDEWRRWGWSFAELEPRLREAEEAIGTRAVDESELGPWARAVIGAAEAAGLPVLDHFNDPNAGVARLPVNIRHFARWNTAFAYLDAARGRDNLSVLDRTLVDRVILDGDRATGATVIQEGRRVELQAGLVVVSAGAFGSPPVLMRSGIGPGEHLAELDLDIAGDLPAVGENLQDHLGLVMVFRPGAALEEALARQEEGGRLLGSGSMVKARSPGSRDSGWDLHLVPWAARDRQGVTGKRWRVQLSPYLMKPLSRGSVRLRDTDPESHPDVRLGYLSDPSGRDLAALIGGIDLSRRIAASEPIATLIEGEAVPGADLTGMEAFVRENIRGYFHPVGTCALGAVVDARCRVEGFQNLYVCDASVIPTIPRANTNLTTIAIAERTAAMLAGGT